MNAAASRPPHVLVVDDDPALRAMLSDALRDAGCGVTEAASGEACLAAIEASAPHTVLLDAMMPGLDGFATCARIRTGATGADVPVLIMTALQDPSAIDRAFAAGATDFIPKPFNLLVLERRVRRLAEAQQAQELLRIHDRAINATPDGVVILDALQPGRPIISVNPAVERITGYPASELLGRTCCQQFDGPDTDPAAARALEAAIGAGEAFEITIRHYRRDGGAFWNHLIFTPVTHARGMVTHMVGVMRDVTAREQAAAALLESEERFRLLFEHSPDGIWLLDPRQDDEEARIVACNQAAARMHGYAREELLGQPAALLIPDPHSPERLARTDQHRRQFWHTGELHGEDRHRRKDGTIIEVEFSMSRVTIAGREMILSTDRDITARKHMEQALRASEERFRLLFEHSPDAIWLLDPHDPEVSYPIVDCNRAACEMHGYTRDELLGKPIEIFAVAPDDPERHARDAAMSTQLAREGQVLGEDLHRAKDGTVLHVEYADTMVVIGGRELVLGIDRNVTMRKQAEAALQRSTERLHHLHAISQAILAVQAPASIAEAALRRVRDLVPSRRASVALIDDVTGAATIIAVDTVGETRLTAGARAVFDALGMRPQLAAGEIVHVAGLGSRPVDAVEVQLLQAEGIQGLLIVPLMTQQTLIGALTLGTDHPRAFSSDEAAIAREVGDLLAVALHNAQLYRSEQAARLVAETLRASSLVVTESLELPVVLDHILEQLGRLLPYDSANVMLLDADEQHLVVTRGRGYAATAGTDHPEVRFDLRRHAILRELVAERRSVLIPDAAARPDWRTVPGAEHVRNWFGVPLVAGGQVIGIYSVDKAEPGFFTRRHVELAEALAPHAAMAVANSRLFAELAASRERLQRLSQQLLEVQEQERRHLARELHDQIGQVLTAVKMNLQMLDRGATPARLADSMALVGQAIGQVRDLSFELRPALLDDLGLVPALRWYAEREAGRAGYRVEVRASGLEARVPPELEVTSFRIVQEALTNVARHARASDVVIEARQKPDELLLRVHDTGAGFDVEAARARGRNGSSLGLLSMRERAELVGGSLSIQSTPGRGTVLEVRFPITGVA